MVILASIVLVLLTSITICAGRKQLKHPKLRRCLEADKVIVDNYIVELDPSKVTDVREAAIRLLGHGGATTATIEMYYEHAIHGFNVAGVTHELLESLLENDQVLGIEENQEVELFQLRQRQQKQKQQEKEEKLLHPPDHHMQQTESWGLDYLDYPEDGTYTWTTSGAGVIVYVIDTGVYTSHVEFGNRASCSFVLPGKGDDCQDDNGHGTNVAGIVGGTVYGVAKDATIRGVKVLDEQGRGSMSGIAAGIDHVLLELQAMKDRPPTVINLSIGGGRSFALNDAINRAVEEGVVVVGAAGNDAGLDACEKSPGSCDSAIVVGGLDENRQPAKFSNVGPCVDIWAPGKGIMGAGIEGVDFYKAKTGTSQSAPFVAGLAALYLELGLSAADTKAAILRDARVIKDLGVEGAAPRAASAPHFNEDETSLIMSTDFTDTITASSSENEEVSGIALSNTNPTPLDEPSQSPTGIPTTESDESMSKRLHLYLRSRNTNNNNGVEP